MTAESGSSLRGQERAVAGETAAVFVISVAAQLSGLHPQTLRQYDRLGLVSPGRASGRGRRYSARDIAALRTVSQLTAEGINLAGVKRILELEGAVAALEGRILELEDARSDGTSGKLTDALSPRGRPASRRTPRRSAPEPANPYLPVPVMQGSTAVVLWRPFRRR